MDGRQQVQNRAFARRLSEATLGFVFFMLSATVFGMWVRLFVIDWGLRGYWPCG